MAHPGPPPDRPDRPRCPETRTDFTAAEACSGIAWLSAGALVMVLVEVASISTLYGIPSMLAAAGLGAVLTRTARLWVRGANALALLPLGAWIIGFALLALGPEVTAAMIAENKIRCAVLFAAACGGGVWPILARK
ncbi:hypothetical protein QYQ98_09735 [Corynebacterium sp. P3-F1]|uniref:hypothetical protein n=1 Tax=Corynebacterium sp. P3-F1 TaxID=3059080 RepID=UPI00265D010D|nr:hypothetical protein [Corynebacterium sp. P3-F1]WKK61278.1 hypothetical protein QYQ98_09735 [Corynebacterium sp. P3-F1]